MPTQTPLYNMSNVEGLVQLGCSVHVAFILPRTFLSLLLFQDLTLLSPGAQQRWCLIAGALLHNHACTLGLSLAVVTEKSCAHFSAVLRIADVEYPSVILPRYHLYVGALNPTY